MTDTGGTRTVTFNPQRLTLPVPDSKLLLAPAIREYFKANSGLLSKMHIDLFDLDRPHKSSGWFSPSTHPTMTLRQLTLYAMAPEKFAPVDFGEDVAISVMMGTIMHQIANQAMLDMGILVKPEGKTCPLCRRPRGYKPGVDQCNEHAVVDTKLRRRGHMDGVLDLPGLPPGTPIDVKTVAHHAIKWIDNHDPVPFIQGKTALKAKYYGQAQEYDDMHGAKKCVFLYIGLGFPWEVREVVVDYDPDYSARLKEKYTKARFYAERGILPPEDPCCKGTGELFKGCGALTCPVKRTGRA